jgi:hypothetical protein
MNTEKIKTLEQIHEAIVAVEIARSSSGLSHDQQYDLEYASVKLWALEQSVIRKKGDDLITALTIDSSALKELSVKIKESAESLGAVAGVLEKVAKVVEALINIIAAALAAGFI